MHTYYVQNLIMWSCSRAPWTRMNCGRASPAKSWSLL